MGEVAPIGMGDATEWRPGARVGISDEGILDTESLVGRRDRVGVVSGLGVKLETSVGSDRELELGDPPTSRTGSGTVVSGVAGISVGLAWEVMDAAAVAVFELIA